jgi:hypothetical protein
VPGDHHDSGVDVPLAHPAERRQAVHARQPDVENDEVVGALRQPLEAGLATVHRIDLVALVAQHRGKGAAHTGLVIHDQNLRHLTPPAIQS